jgi:predicted HTH domain antitoxin
MSVTVTFELPKNLEEKLRSSVSNLNADVQQTYALELFRRGLLSHFDLAATLGLDRYETDALLKKRQIFEGSLTLADLEADRNTLARVMNETR